MICYVDVHYGPDAVVVGGVQSDNWLDVVPRQTWTERFVERPDPYEPGQFYMRELPYLLRALTPDRRRSLEVAVVDGYVWLGAGRPGLGERLREATDRRFPVVGVAKTRFHGNDQAEVVVRGASRRPLLVTASGMPSAEAARLVAAMHGSGRVPELLKLVDRLARGLEGSRGDGPRD